MPNPILFLLLVLVCITCSCSTSERQPAPVSPTRDALSTERSVAATSTLPDMSGRWEKNYARSDDFNNRFSLFIADVQRGFVSRGTQGAVISNQIATRESLLGLARFSEEITRLPQLEIEQSATEVQVERPNDFPLLCLDNTGVLASNDFGAERCGWNREQLIFRQVIGRDLAISHQFTLGPDGNELSIVTTVESAAVGTPLTVSNFYRRVETTADEYGCMLTLTRNTVCSQYGQ